VPDSEAPIDQLDLKLASIDKKLAGLDKKLDEAQGERKNLRFLMTLFTTIMSSVVGLGAWLVETHVQQHLANQTQALQTVLALEQQVYGKELTAYENVHDQIAVLVDSIAQVSLVPTRKKSGMDAVGNLYVAYTTNNLYLSDAIVAQLQQLVGLAVTLPELGSSGGTATTQAVEAQINVIENQMKVDLKFPQLGQIPGLKDRPQP
jgi:hypothetical protein